MSDGYEDTRRRLLEMIATIQRDYQRQIQPYIDQLARLEATRPPSPMLVRCQELLPEVLAQITTDQPPATLSEFVRLPPEAREAFAEEPVRRGFESMGTPQPPAAIHPRAAIAQHVKAIQTVCEAAGYDPLQWLAALDGPAIHRSAADQQSVCQHDLLLPDTTVVVTGEYDAHCPRCDSHWTTKWPRAVGQKDVPR
jgi:hypothetical protein